MPLFPPSPIRSGPLRKLTHFVAVAEEQHFTRAAERLHLAQQALSSSIRRLEQDLGVDLFARNTRQVELTAAGRALLEDAPTLLASFERTWRRTQLVGSTVVAAPIRVGRTADFSAAEIMPLLEPLRELIPGIAFHLTQPWPSDLPQLLRKGGLELAFARALSPGTGICSTPLAGHGQKLSVALHPSDELLDQPTLELSMLTDHRLVASEDPGRSHYTRFLLALCEEAGFRPALRISATQGVPSLLAVEEPGEFAIVANRPGPRRTVNVAALSPAPDAPVRLLHANPPPQAITRIVEHFERYTQREPTRRRAAAVRRRPGGAGQSADGDARRGTSSGAS